MRISKNVLESAIKRLNSLTVDSIKFELSADITGYTLHRIVNENRATLKIFGSCTRGQLYEKINAMLIGISLAKSGGLKSK